MKTGNISWSKTNIWGTHNRNYLNSIIKQRDLFELRIGVMCKQTGDIIDSFYWSGISGNPSFDYYREATVYKTGYHSLLSDYSMIGFQYKDYRFTMEFAGVDERFVCKITPRVFSNQYLLLVECLAQTQKKEKTDDIHIQIEDNKICFFSKDNSDTVYLLGDVIPEKSTEAKDYSGVRFDGKTPVYLLGNCDLTIKKADSFLLDGLNRYRNSHADGEAALGDEVVSSMMMAAGWNKVYDHINDTFQCDVTRLWAPDSCYYSFYWDNLLDALPIALSSKEVAYEQIDSICSEAKEGFIPQCSFEWGSSSMINPPIGSYCLLKLYRQFGDRELLEHYFKPFYMTNSVLFDRKGSKEDGLIYLLGEKEQDIAVRFPGERHDIFTSALATGLDNSPLYDDHENAADVGMSSIFALDCLCLSKIAGILGEDKKASDLHERYLQVKNSINQKLWDDENGIYCNTPVCGKHKNVYTPTSFYPMLAGIPSPYQVNRLINEHLLNEREFWGDYVLPSVSKTHPSYIEQNYWRGCAWGPMNFLVYEGLRSSGAFEAASMLAEKSVKMYRDVWQEQGLVLENYSTITGGITANCVPMYTWGILMGFIGTQELIRFTVDGIELGCLFPQKAILKNVYAGKHRLTIDIRESGMTVELDGKPFMHTTSQAVIRMTDLTDTEPVIISARSGMLTIQSPNTDLLKEISY